MPAAAGMTCVREGDSVDFQSFVDSFFSPACITAVEKTASGGYESFEDVCIDAAVRKKEVHTYAHVSNVDIWGKPLSADDAARLITG